MGPFKKENITWELLLSHQKNVQQLHYWIVKTNSHFLLEKGENLIKSTFLVMIQHHNLGAAEEVEIRLFGSFVLPD